MRVTGRRGGKERGLAAPSPSSPRALIHSGRARRHRGQAAQRAAHRREAGGAREDLGENRYIDDLSVDVRPAVRPRSVPGPGPSAPSQKPGLVAPHPTTPHHTSPHLTSPTTPQHTTPHHTTVHHAPFGCLYPQTSDGPQGSGVCAAVGRAAGHRGVLLSGRAGRGLVPVCQLRRFHLRVDVVGRGGTVGNW